MSILDAALRALFDGLLFPFRSLPAFVGLVVVSLLASVGMLMVYKATSNQTKLAAVKDQISAGMYEIRLFNDDLPALFRAQFEILRNNMTYLGLSLVPMVWMIIPFLLVAAQLHHHYSFRGLETGEPVLLKVQLQEDWSTRVPADAEGRPPLSLDVPAGLRLDSPAVWIPSLNEINWRLVAEGEGAHALGVIVGGETFEKAIQVTDRVVRRAPTRWAADFGKLLLYPAEAPLPRDGALLAVSVAYPSALIDVFGFEVDWLIAFVLLSIVFAFALRKRFGVTI
jgi:uncharacterized membrane protein (DUF106 family)